MNTACTKTKKVAHNNVYFYLEILQFLNILKILILKSNFTTFLIFWKLSPLQENCTGNIPKRDLKTGRAIRVHKTNVEIFVRLFG